MLVAEWSKPKLKTIRQKYKEKDDNGTIFNEIKVSKRINPNFYIERFIEKRNKDNSGSEKEEVEQWVDKNAHEVFRNETLSNGVK